MVPLWRVHRDVPRGVRMSLSDLARKLWSDDVTRPLQDPPSRLVIAWSWGVCAVNMLHEKPCASGVLAFWCRRCNPDADEYVAVSARLTHEGSNLIRTLREKSLSTWENLESHLKFTHQHEIRAAWRKMEKGEW